MTADVCEIMNETVDRLSAQLGDHPLSMLCPGRAAAPDCDAETLIRGLACLLNDALSCTDPSCSVVFSGEVFDHHITQMGDHQRTAEKIKFKFRLNAHFRIFGTIRYTGFLSQLFQHFALQW